MQLMTAKEYLNLGNQSKSENKNIMIDGHMFDSKLEADYYTQIKIRQKAGEILFFRMQPRYLLQHAFEKGGKNYRKIEYVADFEIHHKDGSIEVVDTKGFENDVFRMKEKLFNKKYTHKLTAVKEV